MHRRVAINTNMKQTRMIQFAILLLALGDIIVIWITIKAKFYLRYVDDTLFTF